MVEKLKVITFGQNDIENELAKLTDKEIDELAFGAIEVDSSGKILRFNATEGKITGRKPEEVIGKNFFDDVAPCAKTPEFYGKFLEGVKNKNLNVMFEYLFDYKMAPTKVKVHMKKSITSNDSYWIFVKRL